MPAASHILMVRPAAFGYNPETAVNNYFQQSLPADPAVLQAKALEEFDGMVMQLRSEGLDVLVAEDSADPPKPDALFPNNWLASSPDGKLFIFPMYAPLRRNEKNNAVIQLLQEGFSITDVQDWSEYEAESRFLEGTGSMVIDFTNNMIYAAISERTSLAVLEKFAVANGFQAMVFLAADKNGMPVYHTNVMMSLGEKFCVLCEEAIEEEWELIAVRQLLESTHHQLITITKEQMHAFAGNILQVKNKSGEHLIILSSTAHASLTEQQLTQLSRHGRLVAVAIPTIEKAGGGSVRCMMMEVFLERKK